MTENKLNTFYKNYVSPIFNFLKHNWLIILFVIGFIVIGGNYGFIRTAITLLYGIALFLYTILKSHQFNSLIRLLLNMRVNEDEKRSKEKSGFYRKKAEEASFKVIK